MKIKENLEICSSEPWYDLSDGGYLNPQEICQEPEDAKKVEEAVEIVKDFLDSCEEQIEGFLV